MSSDRLSICGGLLLLSLVGGIAWAVAHWGATYEPEETSGEPRPKVYSQELARDLVVNKHGLYGVDLLKCGSCRIEKMRRGLFTLGGLNVLVIEDLELVLQEFQGSIEDCGRQSAEDVLKSLGISDALMEKGKSHRSFSDVRISSLRINLLRDDGTVVPFLHAKSAKAAKRGGLKLDGCRFMSGGQWPWRPHSDPVLSVRHGVVVMSCGGDLQPIGSLIGVGSPAE